VFLHVLLNVSSSDVKLEASAVITVVLPAKETLNGQRTMSFFSGTGRFTPLVAV
jgi:hypothetical protein